MKIELVRVDGFATPSASLHPTNAFGTTDANGAYDIPITATPPPRLTYTATTRTPSGVEARPASATYVLTYARLSAAASRLPDGRLRVAGTITPALPGRKVRLDRSLGKLCAQNPAFAGRPTPSNPNPACGERWTQDPIATAEVSPDGSTFAIETSTSPGTFRVALDFAGGANVYAGETAPFNG